jgi:DNA invertase Pin-like site-specific DNA recombinase
MNESEVPTYMRFAVAYYRVSTKRQGRSHLGLDAQETAIKHFCNTNSYTLLDEIEEVQSTRKQRPGLQEALAFCQKSGATLIVARLDRLGRDVAEIATIVKSTVEVVVADNPYANRFTIHILAAVAEENRRVGSENTKAALQAAKKRGKKLGTYAQILSKENKRQADEFAQNLLPILRELSGQGIKSVRKIASELNRQNIATFRPGGRWHIASVFNLITRLKTKENSAIIINEANLVT